MLRRSFLAAPLHASALLARQGTKPPNVLMIAIDDLNRSLHCFGNQQVRTPNIDKLAARGMRFTGAYANFASCAPSRASLLSGWYPERTGMITFAPRPRDGRLREAVYLPEHFRKQGYFTARVDKVFHIGSDEPSCWDVSEDPIKDATGKNRIVRTPAEIAVQGLAAKAVEMGECSRCKGERQDYAIVNSDDADLIDGLTSKRIRELMTQAARDTKPFFVAAGLRRPHLPIAIPKKYADMYPPDRIELPPKPPNFDEKTWVPRDEQQRIIARYYAAVTYADARVGELLDTLHSTGQADNTVVVLFGDQGYAHGQRDNHYGKGTLGELSFAVPLILAGPGVARKGAECGKIVELLDIYPTLVDLCGLPAPPVQLQGRSLKPLLRNPRAAWNERAIGAVGNKDNQRPGLSVRTARYRYSETADRTPFELFDYRNDPYEWRNLVQDASHAPVREQLKRILDEDRT